MVGEPLGPVMGDPGLYEDEGNGLASELRAGRCLANSMHANGVEASVPRQCGLHLGAFRFNAYDREAQAPDSLTSQPMV